MRASNCSGWK